MDIFEKIISRHKAEYEKYGYDEKSLCWTKQRQNIRFCALSENFDLQGASILDIGCGFGDFNKYLSLIGITKYDYLGLDINEDFVKEAKKLHPDKDFKHINFLDYKFEKKFDYIITSGIFNYYDENNMNYAYQKAVIKKAFENCEAGIGFDFLSDKTDFKDDQSCHNSPEKILGIAYNYSRNVILKNNFLPFEFTLVMFKNEEFTKQTYFENLEKTHKEYFDKEIFIHQK